MKLRSITLTNVRRFAGKTATISGIGDGVTVIAAPNESGKSTFFDGLQTLFFNAHGSAPKEVKSLQPDPAGGAVGVMAEIELPKGRFRIEKRFLGKKMARVTDLAHGGIVAQDDAAEEWIRGLTDHGMSGPAGLLWVRQGGTAFNAGNTAENAKSLTERRNLLSSVTGEIDLMTGGRRMDRVRDRCQQELDRYATAQGKPKTGGPWKAVKDEIASLNATIADLQARCGALTGALERRRQVEARLKMLENPAAVASQQSALAAATAALAAAEAHVAKVAAADQTTKIARLQQQGHASRLAALVSAIGAAAHTALAADAAARTEADLAGQAATAAAAESRQTAHLAACVAEVKALRERIGASRAAEARLAAGVKAAELATRLEQAEQHRNDAEKAEATVAANPATPERIQVLDRAMLALSQAQALAAAQAVTLSLRYDGVARVQTDGRALPPGLTVLGDKMTLDLPGIGQMIVDPGRQGRTDDGAVAKAEKAANAALAACGAFTQEAAHQAAKERQEAENAARLARVMLATLAPDGLPALRTLWTAAADMAGSAQAPDAAEDLVTLEAAIGPAERAETEARAQTDAARRVLASLQSDLAAAKSAAVAGAAAHLTAETAAGDPATRDERRAAAERATAQAGADLRMAEEALASLAENAPDVMTAKAEHARAQSVVAQSERETTTLRLERAALVATIQSQADAAPEERLAEALGAREAAAERDARLTADVAALTHLLSVIEATRSAAREAYFDPVQRELQPLLSILSNDAAITFDSDRLLPGQLARAGMAEPIDRLSGGTQEQIAILTRLAFARLFAKAGSPVPVILDDALVHTDDERIVRMFLALHRVAADQQVIVFTCRQLAFDGLGGDRPDIVIADI